MRPIRQHIREAVKQGGDLSPAAISRRVLDRLTNDELRPALAAALPYLVRDEVRKARGILLGDKRDDRPNRHEWGANDAPAPVADLNEKRRAAGRKGAQMLNDRRAALLGLPVAIAGTWKRLGDCTASDLRTLAADGHARAAEDEKRAVGYERLADEMDRAGSATVAGFADVATIREAFGVAA